MTFRTRATACVPDDLEGKINEEAKRQRKSVSSFVLDAVKSKIEPQSWSAEFLSMLAVVSRNERESGMIPTLKIEVW